MENMPSRDDILSFSNELTPQVSREVLSEIVQACRSSVVKLLRFKFLKQNCTSLKIWELPL